MLTSEDFTQLLGECPLVPVQLCPELLAHQARDLFGVWQKMERASGQRKPSAPPFWATVWPGAALLARLLLDEPGRVVGRRVWDLGCGGGVAAIAAARAGAKWVVANDVDELALRACQENAQANHVTLSTQSGDMLQCLPGLGPEDVVLVSEMFYEQTPSEQLLEQLRALVSHGAEVLIADGGRPFAPTETSQVLRSARLSVPELVEGVSFRDVRVFSLGNHAGRVAN